jgi:Zn-dependent protease with chaperone function
MEFADWIIAVLVYVSFFLCALIAASISYYEYTKSPDRKGLLLFAFYGVPASLAVLLLGALFFGLSSPQRISTFALVVFFIFFILSVVYTIRDIGEYHCSKEEPVSAGSLDFVACYGGPLNTWYNHRKKRIYIGDKLLKVLNEEELKALYYHEEGHRKRGYLVYLLLGSIRVVWLLLFSLAFVIVWVIAFGIAGVATRDYLFLLVILVSLTSSISAISIMWNWLSEHMSDVYSTGKVGAKPLITALVKLYVHRWLEKSGISTYNARVSLDLDVEAIVKELGEPRFLQIFKLLLERSLHSALGVVRATSIYEVPVPDTHPPLEYRVLVLWRSQLTR